MAKPTSMNGKLKFYLDQMEQDFSTEDFEYQRDVIYPPERDVINRKGQSWHVLSIDLDSIYGSFNVPTSALVSKTIANPFLNRYPNRSNDIRRRVFLLADLYYYLYKDAPLFKCFDANGNVLTGIEVSVDDRTMGISSETSLRYDGYETYCSFSTYNALTGEGANWNDGNFSNYIKYSTYKFTFSNGASVSSIKKIKLYFNQRMADLDAPFYEKTFNNNGYDYDYDYESGQGKFIYTYEIAKNGIFVPFFFTYNGEILKDVTTTFHSRNDYGSISLDCVSLTFEKNDILLEKCEEVNFVLALDYTVDVHGMKALGGYMKGYHPNIDQMDTMRKFIRIGDAEKELTKSSVEIDAENEMVHVIADTSFSLEHMTNVSNIDFSHISFAFLPFDENTYTYDIDNTKIRKDTSTVVLENIVATDSMLVSKEDLNMTNGERLYNVNQRLTKLEVLDSEGSVNRELPIDAYRWSLTDLRINFNGSINDESVKLTFVDTLIDIDKEEFKTSSDFLWNFEPDEFLDEAEAEEARAEQLEISKRSYHPYIYILSGQNYDTEIETGYIYSNTDVSSTIHLYDDLAADTNLNARAKLIDFHAIYKFTIIEDNYFDKNISIIVDSIKTSDGIPDTFNAMSVSVSEKRPDDEWKAVKSKINYATDETTIMLTSADFDNMKECHYYKFSSTCLYGHNDFRDLADLQLSIVSGEQEIGDEIDIGYEVSSTYHVNVVSPLVHINGWMTDCLGNKILETPGMIRDFPPNSSKYILNDNDKENGNCVDVRYSSKVQVYLGYNDGSRYTVNKNLPFNILKTPSYTRNRYTVLKGNETTPLKFELINNDESISADLSYVMSTVIGYAYKPNRDSWRVDVEDHEVDYYDSECYLGSGYVRSMHSMYELSGEYDFIFASIPDETLPYQDYKHKMNKYSVYPGEYTANVYEGDEILTSFTLDCTKENENSLFGLKIVHPRINVIGQVFNEVNNEKIHKDGMIIRMINLDTEESFDFTYRCELPFQEGLTGIRIPKDSPYIMYSDDREEDVYLEYGWNGDMWVNAWDETFRFAYSGIDSNCIYWKDTVSGDTVVHNADSLRASKGLEPGLYKIELIYDNEVLSTYYEPEEEDEEEDEEAEEAAAAESEDEEEDEMKKPLEVSRENQANLYNIMLPFPLCKVYGAIYNEDGEVQYGDDVIVIFENTEDDTKSRSYTLYKKDHDSGNELTGFMFNGLGMPRAIWNSKEGRNDGSDRCIFIEDTMAAEENDLGMFRYYYYDINSSNYLKGYAEPGLWPGTYNVRVIINNVEKYSETIEVNKEEEAAGNLYDMRLVIADNKSNLTGSIVNDYFEKCMSGYSGIIDLIESNNALSPESDSNYTGSPISVDISSSKFIIDNLNNDSSYAISLSANVNVWPYGDNFIKIPIKDITRVEDETSYYSEAGTLNSSKDILLLNEMPKSKDQQVEVHVPYWMHRMYRAFCYTDEHSEEDFKAAVEPAIKTSVQISSAIDHITTMTSDTNNTLSGYKSYVDSGGDVLQTIMKSSEYDVSLIDFEDTSNVLESAHIVLSGEDATVVSSSLGLGTLNIIPLLYRDDINRYVPVKDVKFTLKRMKDGEDYYRDLINEFAEIPDYNYYNGIVSYEKTGDAQPFRYTHENKIETASWTPEPQMKYAVTQLPLHMTTEENNVVRLTAKIKTVSGYCGTISGIYKLDLSNGFDNLQDEIPSSINDIDTSNLNYLLPISFHSALKNYLLPIKSKISSISSWTDDEIVSSMYSDVSLEQYNNALSSVGFDEYDTPEFEVVESMMGSVLNDYSGGKVPIQSTLLDMAGVSSFMDLVKNVAVNGYFTDLKLKNPNDLPIKYYTLLMTDLRISFRAVLMLKLKDGRLKRYMPHWFGIEAILQLDDIEGSERFVIPCRESFSGYNGNYSESERCTCFSIIDVPVGWHNFVVFFNGVEVYNKRIYCYENKKDLYLEVEDPFIKNVLYGEIKLNGNVPPDDVHIRVFKDDIPYYGSYVVQNVTDEYYYHRLYMQNSVDGSYYNENEIISNRWKMEYPSTTDNEYFREAYGAFDNSLRKRGKYRLYDLLPGNYKVKFYVMPMTTDDTGNWTRRGDSYYYKTFNADDIHDGAITASISSVLSGKCRDEYQLYADWGPMEVILRSSISGVAYNKVYNELYEISTSNESKVSRSIKFQFERDEENEDNIIIHVGENLFTRTEWNHCIETVDEMIVLFGERVSEFSIEDVNDDTSGSLGTVDLTRCYTRETTINYSNYDFDTSGFIQQMDQYGIYSLKHQGLSGEISTNRKNYVNNFRNPNYRNVKYYGLEADNYVVSCGFDEPLSCKLAEEYFTLSAANTTITMSIKNLGIANIKIEDAALKLNGLSGADVYIKNTNGYGMLYMNDPVLTSVFSSGYVKPNTDSTIRLSGLLDKSYSFGFYHGVYDWYDSYYSTDTSFIEYNSSNMYKFYTFDKSSITSGIGTVDVSGITNVTLDVPYQRLKLTLSGFNLKEDVSFTPSYSNLTFIRHNGDAYDGNITPMSQNGNRYLKSGLYTIKYSSNRSDGSEQLNIEYPNILIKDDTTITVYDYLANCVINILITDNGNPIEESTELYIYDKHKNLYKEVTVNNGVYSFVCYNVEYYFQVGSKFASLTNVVNMYRVDSTIDIQIETSNTELSQGDRKLLFSIK